MFDFGLGSSELLLIAIVALIVIGPKDLPRLLRTMGQYMRKVQGMAREFQNHLNEAAKEAGVDDVKKEVKGMTNFTVTTDLDKQGNEIKRAIESSAPKPSAPNGAGGAKTDSAAKDKAEPKTEPAKPAPAAGSKPVAATEPVTPAKPKAAKAKPEAKPKPKPKAQPKPKAAPKKTGKADRPSEAVKS